MTKKRKRETSRKTKGVNNISALINKEIEDFFSRLDSTPTKDSQSEESTNSSVGGVANMKTFFCSALTKKVYTSKSELYEALCRRLSSSETKNRTLQQTINPLSSQTSIRLPAEMDLGQGPPTKHQKTFGDIRNVTTAHPCETLIDYIETHKPTNCLSIPMMQDCGLDDDILNIMTPEDAIAYHIMIRTAALVISFIDFKIINETQELAYSQNYEMAIYIMFSYLLRRKPPMVNPCEIVSDDDFVNSLAQITKKVLIYTDFDRKKSKQASSFIKRVCIDRWDCEKNMIEHLLTMFASSGAMSQIVQSIIDAGDMKIREPKSFDSNHQSKCFVTSKYLPVDELVEVTFVPSFHTDLETKIAIRKELAAPFYGLFVWFNLPWVMLQKNDIMTTNYTHWLCRFTAVLRFAEKNYSQYLYRTLDQLTRI